MAIDEKRVKEYLAAFPDEFIHLRETEQRISAHEEL